MCRAVKPAGVVEVHGARRGGVDDPFEYEDDLVGAFRVPGEGGEFGGGEGDGGTGFGKRAVGLAAEGPAEGAGVRAVQDVCQIGVRRILRRHQPGPHSSTALPRHRQVPHDQHDGTGQQRLADAAPGGRGLTADHHQGEDENGDDGGLGSEVPRGDGNEGTAESHERDEPSWLRQHRGESGEDDSSEDRPRGPAQNA